MMRDYAKREKYACDVCGNVPDENGIIEHGKGCYTQSEDGGGTSVVEFDPCEHERLNDHEDACLDCGAVYIPGEVWK